MNKNNLSLDVLKKKTSFSHFQLIMRTTIILLFISVFISVAGIDYRQNTTASIIEESATIQQEKKELSGTVVDGTGISVIGANILEVGTTNGTITDIDGHFSLLVEKDAVIKVSYIGYLEQEINTSGRDIINVTLTEDMQSLDELVVVGYGVQKKKLITGANLSVGSETIQRQNSMEALDAIQSFAPGVNITQSSGMPGQGYQVNIRGLGTVGNSSPLYVIDGVTGGDINNLNPSDIETIDVLKDAASAAIYGARAANGVILVTTKGGTKGRMQVTYDGFFGFQDMVKVPKMLNAKQYMEIYNEERVTSGQQDALDFASVIPGLYQDISSGKWNGTNWIEEIRNKNAPIQNHSINISGAILALASS